MFGNHRLLKVAWLCFVLAGIPLATPAVKAPASPKDARGGRRFRAMRRAQSGYEIFA